jgi:uncharacterized protein
MREIIEKIKKQMLEECSKPEFEHHSWYWEQHIQPMLKIALELADKYKVDKEMIELAVYVHDVAKIRGLENHAEEGAKIADSMLPLFTSKKILLECIAKHNKPSSDDPVEVKIIAAADAVSHFISPFFEIYIQENAGKPLEELFASNLRKAEKDWKKILLPEAKMIARNAYEELKVRYNISKHSLTKSNTEIKITDLVNNLEKYSHENIFGPDCFSNRKNNIIKDIKSGVKPTDIMPIKLLYDQTTGLYQFIDGCSRTRAFMELGISKINCDIRFIEKAGFDRHK